MDKIVEILEWYDVCSENVWRTLEEILNDQDISPMDVLQALESAGMIDIDELHIRVMPDVRIDDD